MRTSALGSDFPRERFLCTPVSIIRWTLRQLDEQEQAQANLAALGTARLTQLVLQIAHGFSGSKGAPPKTPVRDFLPFPEWRPGSRNTSGPDQPTKFILAELGKRGELPLHVLSALLTPSDQRP